MGKKSKLKGQKRVNKIINEFFEQEFGLKAHLMPSFEYNRMNHKVGYTLAITEDADQYFIPFYQHLNPNVKADIFLVSIFHEVGHHFTAPGFPEYVWEESNEIKDRISENLGKYPEKSAKWNNTYFNLDVEKAATKWALDYMESHDELVADFWAELQPAIMRFYKKNGLI